MRSNQEKKIVAYIHAQGVPMAVPISWVHQVSPNVKTLFSITNFRSCIMKEIGGRDVHSEPNF